MSLLVQIKRLIPASPEVVYDAWTDPVAIGRFMCPSEGMTVRDVAVNAVVGGAFSFTMVAGETLVPIQGEYKVMERPRRLAFSWFSHRTTPASVVTLTFEAVDGQTQMTLRHQGLPDESSATDHEAGWQAIAECLVREVA